MQQQNKKRRFNIVDLLITVIILVVIAFIAYIFFFGNIRLQNNENAVKIQYTLEVRDEYDVLIDPAGRNVGKELIDGTLKYNLGDIVDFYTEQAYLSTYSVETGQSQISDYPEHSNFYFVVEAEAERNPESGRYTVDGFELSVGTLIYARMPHYSAAMYCIGISEISE